MPNFPLPTHGAVQCTRVLYEYTLTEIPIPLQVSLQADPIIRKSRRDGLIAVFKRVSFGDFTLLV